MTLNQLNIGKMLMSFPRPKMQGFIVDLMKIKPYLIRFDRKHQ